MLESLSRSSVILVPIPHNIDNFEMWKPREVWSRPAELGERNLCCHRSMEPILVQDAFGPRLLPRRRDVRVHEHSKIVSNVAVVSYRAAVDCTDRANRLALLRRSRSIPTARDRAAEHKQHQRPQAVLIPAAFRTWCSRLGFHYITSMPSLGPFRTRSMLRGWAESVGNCSRKPVIAPMAVFRGGTYRLCRVPLIPSQADNALLTIAGS